MTFKQVRRILSDKRFYYEIGVTLASSAIVLYCAITQAAFLFASIPLLILRLIYRCNKYVIKYSTSEEQKTDIDIPSYSVVICSYNEKKENLTALINCIRNSTVQPKEIIIIDDCSEVPVSNITNSNVTVYRNSVNIGKKESQAVALKHLLPADYILFLDSDISFDDNAIKKSLEFISEHSDGLVFGVRVMIKDYKKDYLNTFINNSYYISYNKRLFESSIGVTLSCNGAFMFCQYSFLLNIIDSYIDEKLFGEKISIGNDKSLTNFGLMHGKSYTVPDVTIVHDSFQFRNYLKKISRTFKTSIIYQVRTIFLSKASIWARLLSVIDLYAFFFSVPLQIVFIIALLHISIFYVFIAAYIIFLALRSKNSFFDVLSYTVFRFSFVILLQVLRLYALLRIRTIKWGNR